MSTQTGAFYICLYSFTDYSAQITVTETIAEQDTLAVMEENQITTQLLPRQTGKVFLQYYNKAFVQDRVGNITLYLEYQYLMPNQQPPDVYYHVCTKPYAECLLDETALIAAPNKVFTAFEGGVRTANTYEITFKHSPANCARGTEDCSYVFGVQNKYR